MKAISLRKPIYDSMIYLVLILLAAALVLFPSDSLSAAKTGIELCVSVIIPSLFPFFVVSALVVRLGAADKLCRFFEKIMRPLFGVSGACAPALILGFIGGYPVGAKTTVSLYENGSCTKEEAESLLAFCNNSGPAFIFGVVGAGIFGSALAGLLLFLSHIASAVVVGILLRTPHKSQRSRTAQRAPSPEPFPQAFVGSVRTSFDSALAICGFVIFFSVIIRLLDISGILPTAAKLLSGAFGWLGMSYFRAKQLLSGFIELSTGVWSLFNDQTGIIGVAAAASFMLGWAGLSVHCQTLSILGGCGLSTRKYLLGKALHGVLSALLTALLFPLFFSVHTFTLSEPTLAPVFETAVYGQYSLYLFIPVLIIVTTYLLIRAFQKNSR